MKDTSQERSLQDRAYDLLGELIAEREAEQLLQAFSITTPEKEAEIEAFFAKHDKKYKRQIAAFFRKKRLHMFATRTLPEFGRIAAIFCACVVIATGAAAAMNETFRATVVRLLVSAEKTATLLEPVAMEGVSLDVPDGWGGTYFPTYMPSGLEVTSVSAWYDFTAIEYKSLATGQIALKLSEYRLGTVISLDTENTQVYEVWVNGEAGLMVCKEDVISVYWCQDQSCFLLTVRGETEDTVLRIAESVRTIH